MAWIGGISSKTNMSRHQMKRNLAAMTEAACPPKRPSTADYPRCKGSVLDDQRGRALAQISISTEGTPLEQVRTDSRDKPALMYDGHLYDFRKVDPNLPEVHNTADRTAADSLVRLLAILPGNLERKVKRALPALDGDYALALGDIDSIVISQGHSTLPRIADSSPSLLARNRCGESACLRSDLSGLACSLSSTVEESA
jgi:hypothetical protein